MDGSLPRRTLENRCRFAIVYRAMESRPESKERSANDG
ncbi:hypothetical protein HSB1_11780 [Halogranum salarium B-1]|uniref:Uncharacterized protein n=1 Tax=Halogranum salarium B-1 TaxID=1210908 RepID=J2ZIM9_9EURY|nr:hypothetical protein HSB1_11780 [Halogranum salarium B-1]